jgi:hypothetical protein
MASDEILERLDAHMAQSNEHLAEIRLENREALRRHEVSFKQGLEVIEENLAAMREVRTDLRDLQVEIRANTRWVEAQTKAVLQLIDEFRGGLGPGPAPA